MRIQSTRRFIETLNAPEDARREFARGEVIEIDQEAVPDKEDKAIGNSVRALENTPLTRDVTIRIPEFKDPVANLKFQAALHKNLAGLYEKQAEIAKPDEQPREFSVSRTAGYVVLGGGAGYTGAVLAQAIFDTGKNSGNPWVSTASIACGLFGGFLAADAANEGIVMELGEKITKIYKDFKD